MHYQVTDNSDTAKGKFAVMVMARLLCTLDHKFVCLEHAGLSKHSAGTINLCLNLF